MLTAVEICNIALYRIGWKTKISALTDGTTEAEMCNAFYDHCRRKALAKADWHFARKRLALTPESGDPPSEWAYQYQWETDCLAPRRLVDGLQVAQRDQFVNFTIAWDDDVNKRLIYTDMDNAALIYTYDEQDPAQFPPLFEDYLSWFIASEVAMPLSNNTKRREQALGMMRAAFSDAVRHNIVTEAAQYLGIQAGVYKDGPTMQSRG